jgi:hypothetical protein
MLLGDKAGMSSALIMNNKKRKQGFVKSTACSKYETQNWSELLYVWVMRMKTR